MKIKIILGFILLTITLIFSGCGQSDNVRLFDYTSLDIPEEEYSVSESELSFAVKMKLMEKDVLVPKTENADKVEEGDRVELTVSEDAESKRISITAGDAEISEGFDSQIMGMKTGQTKSFTDNGTEYKVTVEKISTYAEELSEEIAQDEFGCSSKEAEEMIKKEIEDHRKFDYAYQQLICGTLLRAYDENRDAYINRVTSYINTLAQREGTEPESYYETVLETTKDEYIGYLNNFYDEYVILKKVCELEKVKVTEREVDEYAESFMLETGLSREEYDGLYGDEYAYCSLYYDAVYDILLKYV